MFSSRIAPLSLTLLVVAFFGCTTSAVWAQPKHTKQIQEVERPIRDRDEAPKKGKAAPVGNSAIHPTPRSDKVFKARHQANLARAKKGNVDVLFLGDGIMHGWETTGQAAFKKHFGTLKTANFGIETDRTENVLWRITQGKELDGIDPKVVVLMIGTNNLGINRPVDIAEAIEAIVKSIRTQKPNTQVLLMPLLPRGVHQKDPLRAQSEAVALPLLARVLSVPGITFKEDIGDDFVDAKGDLKKALFADAVHLSPRGYDLWAEKIDRDVHLMATGKSPVVTP